MINKIYDVPSFSLFNNFEIIKKLKYKVNEIIDKINEPAPEELPVVTSEDNGDVLTVVEGAWNKAELPEVLPEVTSADNGDVLTVVEGVWNNAELPDVLPSATSEDNGDVLTVVEGVWNKAELPKPVNYSTDEKVIGTWIDGKPIYEKFVIFDFFDSATANINNGDSINPNITNLDKLLITEQYLYDLTESVGNTSQSIMPMFENQAGTYFLYFDTADKVIKISNTSTAKFAKPDARNIRQFWANCRYTKTTD